jgi:hypothetical protein
MSEITALKERIDQIDREIGMLQNEKLIKGLRFQLLLKQNAQLQPPVESQKANGTRWYDAEIGHVGCKEKTV